MTLAGVIFDAAVRSSVVLGIALAACAALRHRSAAVRHMASTMAWRVGTKWMSGVRAGG